MDPPANADDQRARGRRRVGGRVSVAVVVGSAVLLAVAAVAAFGVRSTEDGPYRALDADEFDASISGCRVSPEGNPTATGNVANRTGADRAMVVEVAVVDADGTVIDTPRATVVSLADGASTRWEVRSPYDVGQQATLTCQVSDVFAAAPG